MEQWHAALAFEAKFLKAMRTPTLDKQLLTKVIPRRWANDVTRDAIGQGIRLKAQYVMTGVLNFPLTQKVYIELSEMFNNSVLKAMRTPTLDKQLLTKVIPRRWANAVTRDAMGQGIHLKAQYVMTGVLILPLTQKVYIELPKCSATVGTKCAGYVEVSMG